jgi:DNA-binding response OmpR family regulator
VLVAEDDAAIRKLLAAALRRRLYGQLTSDGLFYLPAGTGRAARRRSHWTT